MGYVRARVVSVGLWVMWKYEGLSVCGDVRGVGDLWCKALVYLK